MENCNSISCGGFDAIPQPDGTFKYIQKAMTTTPLKKKKATYQDKADIPAVEQVENDWKDQYKKVIRITTTEIGKFLKSKS